MLPFLKPKTVDRRAVRTMAWIDRNRTRNWLGRGEPDPGQPKQSSGESEIVCLKMTDGRVFRAAIPADYECRLRERDILQVEENLSKLGEEKIRLRDGQDHLRFYRTAREYGKYRKENQDHPGCLNPRRWLEKRGFGQVFLEYSTGSSIPQPTTGVDLERPKKKSLKDKTFASSKESVGEFRLG